ncbi:MAG: hypothetical protein ACI93R_003010 [Flavobacteriales bacterium]|jgi:hypothetical protein
MNRADIVARYALNTIVAIAVCVHALRTPIKKIGIMK